MLARGHVDQHLFMRDVLLDQGLRDAAREGGIRVVVDRDHEDLAVRREREAADDAHFTRYLVVGPQGLAHATVEGRGGHGGPARRSLREALG